MRKNLLFLVIISLFYTVGFAQNFSNKGKDFWVGYGNHVRMFNAGGAESMQIYLTSDVNTSGSIIFTSGTASLPFVVTANQITVVQIPRSEFLNDEGLYSRGIRITALNPVVAYGFIYVNAVSGATVFLPTNTLGKVYYSLNYRQLSNEPNSYSYFFVEAVEPGNTVVEITPTQTTKNGWVANVPQTVTLTQGQIYQVLSLNDLTGSKIQSIAPPNGDCKKIAVFCGSGKISIGCSPLTSPTTATGSSDNLYQQMYPYATWGKKYITLSSANTSIANTLTTNNNRFRILRPDPTSNVTLNGTIIPNASFTNNYYDFSSNLSSLIEADKPIMVAQYFTTAAGGAGCPSGNNNPHDPEMIYLNPVEQTISDVTLNSMQPAANTAITQHFINVIVKNGGTALSSFKIDGAIVPPSAFTVLPQDNSYSYARIWKQGGSTTTTATPLAAGVHRLVCDSGFNAIAYGFGSAESYGYSAGANLKDLTNAIAIQNNLSMLPVTDAVACSNSPFSLKLYLQDSALTNTGPFAGQPIPVRYDSMRWNITPNAVTYNNGQIFPYTVTPSNQAVLSGIPASNFPPHYPNPVVRPDSTSIVNGKTVKWYFFPYSLNSLVPGSYNVTVTGYLTNSVADCGSSTNEKDFEFPLTVAPRPSANFDFIRPGCVNDVVEFTETTPQSPYSTYAFYWNFGEPASINNISISRNPTHLYSNASSGVNDFTVKHASINAAGCISDTVTKIVQVPLLANATISGTTAVCVSSNLLDSLPITFTGVDGKRPYKFTYVKYVNGVPGTAIDTSSSANTSTVTINVPINVAGVYKYVLTNIKNDDETICTRTITNQEATVTVNPLPTATIAGTIDVCQNATAPTVTFTGANATAPYTFTYNINGGANQTITTTTGNSVTLAAPTTTVGTYNYNLVSVKDASSTLCTNPAVGIATVVVQAKPNATIAGTVSLCQDAAAPVITFNGINGNAPFSFTYNINGGATQTVSSLATSNSVTVPVSMATSGTFIYNLLSVQNTGPTTCITNITGASATVIINPVPTAAIIGSTTICQVAGPQPITFTGSGGTRPYTFTYSINGVIQTTVNTTAISDSYTLNAPVTTTGTFVYKIISVRDASSTLCLNTFALVLQPTATVVVQATSSATIATNMAAVCQDATAPVITFSATNGTSPFTFTYNINGGATQTITTSATSGSVTLPVSMAASGTFVYNLLSVKNTGPTNCTTPITGVSTTVVINPIPSASISIAGTNATTVCQNTTQPVITFGGLSGTAPYTINYTLNGVAQTPIIIASTSATINAPTNVAGVFTYVVTSIKDATSTQCIKTYSTGAPTVIVTVKQLATAAVTASVPTVCQNSAAPFITFTATGGVAPFTFTYKINGGSNLTVTSPFGNSANVPVPTLIAGTYIYTLVSVQESSIVNCVNAQTGNTQVIVHPQPTASFLPPIAPYCEQKAITFSPTFAVSPTGSVVSWVWDYGDGTGAHIRTDGNPFTVTYPTAGIKNVTYKTVSDKGCESVLFLNPININVKPKAGFINPGACLADPFANFTDTSKPVGTIALWEWDFGDIGSPTNLVSGSTPAQQNPQHAYLAVGPKSVKLTVTTASGCKADTTQTFFINGVIALSDFILLNPTAVCTNRPVKIKDASAVAVGDLIRVDIYWDNVNAPTVFEQDNVPTLGKVFSHNYPISLVDKTYQIRYVSYTGYDVSCYKEVIRNIVVHGAPVAQFGVVPDVCLNGGPVTLTQANSSTGIGVYMGTGVTQTGSVFTFDPSATGVAPGSSYTISYAASSTAGCDSTKTQQIKVLRPPVVDSFKTVGNLCRINDITFYNKTTNGDGAIVKWIYDWGDGTPNTIRTTGADVTHQYATAGIKTATLTLETGYGCRNIPFPVTFTVNPLPEPNYTPSPTACLPSANIVFTNNTPGPLSNYTFNWSFELPSTTAANTSTQPNPNHTYVTQGPYNTQLIATIIATGCKDSTAIIPIGSSIIHPEPVLRFDAIPDVCLNNGIKSFLLLASQTDGTILGGPGIFTGPGIVSANGDFNPLIAGVGTHTITYKWTSSFGCPNSITKQVKVLAAPMVNTFTTVGNICEQNGTVFHNDFTQGAGNIVTWVYDWGDGTPVQSVNNGNDTTHVYSSFGTYPATLYVITNDGCKSLVKPLSVVVNALPKPDFTFTPIACLPQAKIDFTNITPAQSTGGLAYQWVFDDVPATIKTSINADFTYYTLGSHPVQLIATNTTTFCKKSFTQDIMNSLHPAPTASFNFSKPSVCIKDNVIVMDGPSNPADGSMTDWKWNYGDNAAIFTGQIQAPHTYASAGTYNVKLTVTNNFGCKDDTTRTFIVHPYPVINAGRDSVILQGGNMVLTATASGNDLSYLWTGTPGPINLNNTTILNPLAAPVEDIYYTLKVTARGGCADTNGVFIKVLKYPIIPNTFTPNNDGVHDTWVIKYLESYPENRVQVFTRTGQLVFESKRYLKPWDGTMNGKSLPFDTYYFILEPGSGRKPISGYVTIVK